MNQRQRRLIACWLCALGAPVWLGGCAGGGGGAPATTDASAGFAPGVEAMVDRAESLLSAGDKAAAIAELERAIEINPASTRANMTLADIHRMDGDYAKAQVSYARAAGADPANFDAQFLNGLMLHALSRVGEAIKAYLRALALRPDDFRTTLNLASAYFEMRENAPALSFAERAVRLDPRSGEARYTLGSVYAEMGRHEQAVVEFQQATELMPLTPDLLLALGKSLGALQRWDEMRNALAQCVQNGSPDGEGGLAEAYERLGFAEFKCKRFTEARDAFQRSLAIAPDYYPALNGLGVSELNTWILSDRNDEGAKERGLGALRRSIQINRDQPRILELLSRYK